MSNTIDDHRGQRNQDDYDSRNIKIALNRAHSDNRALGPLGPAPRYANLNPAYNYTQESINLRL